MEKMTCASERQRQTVAGHSFGGCGCEIHRMSGEFCTTTQGIHHHSLGGSLVVACMHPHEDRFRTDTPSIAHGIRSKVPQGLSSLFSSRKLLQVSEWNLPPGLRPGIYLPSVSKKHPQYRLLKAFVTTWIVSTVRWIAPLVLLLINCNDSIRCHTVCRKGGALAVCPWAKPCHGKRGGV